MNSSSIRRHSPKQKKLKLWQNVQRILGKYLKQFLSQTTLQSLQYVGNTNLNIIERTYFFLWFVAVVIFAYYMATSVYSRWESMPILIALQPHTTPITTLPFPAITVCNMNQVKYSKVANFSSDSLDYAMRQKICFQDFDHSVYDHLKPKSREDTFSNFILRNAQKCENMIVYCKFAGEENGCEHFFRPVLLDEGLCCAFNIIHPTYHYKGLYTIYRDYVSTSGRIPVDWNPEHGYTKDLPLSFYPREAKGPGISLGFTVVLNANLSEYYCSSTNGAGLKIMAHNPIDTPHIRETGITVAVGSQFRFRLTVNSFRSQPAIRSVSRKRRQCVFNNEVHLHYYKYYTRRNCEMECDSAYMLRRCNCIPYHLPLIHSNASVCHVKDFNCVAIAEAQVNQKEHLICKQECLPGCFLLQYDADVFSTPFVNTSFGTRDLFFRNLSTEFINENLALVQLYFPDDFFRSKIKTPYTSFTDYLAQTGGVMTLMMGFSFISICEVFYFFLIRPMFDFLLKRPAEPQSTDAAKVAVFTVQSRQYNYNPYLIAKKRGVVRNFAVPQMLRNDIRSVRNVYNYKGNYNFQANQRSDSPSSGHSHFPYVE